MSSRERTTVLVVGGMHSGPCVTRIERALGALSGVRSVSVNLLTRMAVVRHDHDVGAADLIKAVAGVGYEASPAASPTDATTRRRLGDSWETIASRRARFIAGMLLTAALFFVGNLDINERRKALCLFLLATPVQLTVGWEFYRGFWRALRRAAFNMDTLVVLGSSAAYLQGTAAFVGCMLEDPEFGRWTPRFDVAALILTVISFGRWLESRMRETTRKLWGSLLEITPRYARVLRDGREQMIPAGVVAPGDTVLVGTGEKIPVDGEIIEGVGEVNEVLMTGEDDPVPKVRGDCVLTACENVSSPLRLRATGVGAESSLARIAGLVEAARERKTPLEQTADRAAAILVPVTLAVAVLTFLTWYFGPLAYQRGWLPDVWSDMPLGSFLKQTPNFLHALLPTVAVLIVSCPYALGLAAPLATLVAIGVAARKGILVRDGPSLEAAAATDSVVFCKVGVLTDGSGALRDILTGAEINAEEVRAIAGALEAKSRRGLSKLMMAGGKRPTGRLDKVDDFSILPGRGLRGVIRGRTWILGPRGVLSERGHNVSGVLEEKIAAAEAEGLRVVILADEAQGPVGALTFEAELREDAAETVTELERLGMHVHLLSSEAQAAARAAAVRCGLPEANVHAALGPEEQIDFIRQLRDRGHKSVAIGDGIDDAPALAAADVGIVLGGGADFVAGAGSFVLLADNPRGLPRILKLARATRRIIRWNLIWAFSFNVIMIPLAALNRLEVWYAVAAAVLSSILVVLSSLQITYFPLDGRSGGGEGAGESQKSG
jgi:Cu+-exporting ATPase